MNRFLILVASAMCAFALCAASSAEPFPKPSEQAAKALKVTKGKPFSSGYVFVNGKYIAPPYTVERYGTVIRINSVQVTREIVPWTEFIKTQEGVTVTKSEAAPDAGGGDADAGGDDLFDDGAEEESEADDDLLFDDGDEESSLDDLFDDEPKEKKKAAAKKPAKKKKAPKPKKPAVTVSYSFDGEFVANDKSKALLQKVNDRRTKIDELLRKGGYYFFGTRYASVSGDKGAAKTVFDKLPSVMQANSNRDKFMSAMRAARLNYLPEALLEDLFGNRHDYIQLIERRKSEQKSREWQKLMGE